MSTLALNDDWDIYFDEDGCIAIANGCEEIVQCIKQNLLSINTINFVGQNIDINVLDGLIKNSILDVDGVISLTSFSISADPQSCGFVDGINVNFQVLTTCGLLNF